MASLIGISSIYKTPTLELYKRETNTTSTATAKTSLLQLFDTNPHFNNVLRAHNHISNDASRNFKSGFKPRVSFVPTAIASPNSFVLSKEALTGVASPMKTLWMILAKMRIILMSLKLRQFLLPVAYPGPWVGGSKYNF